MSYSSAAYYKALQELAGGALKPSQSAKNLGLTQAEAQKKIQDIESERFQSEYAPSDFKMNEFEGLLNRLESSKMRQTGQRGEIEGRNIYRQGLANMMTNF
jgi:hypothetical protein